jgi:hypothetical protein
MLNAAVYNDTKQLDARAGEAVRGANARHCAQELQAVADINAIYSIPNSCAAEWRQDD